VLSLQQSTLPIFCVYSRGLTGDCSVCGGETKEGDALKNKLSSDYEYNIFYPPETASSICIHM